MNPVSWWLNATSIERLIAVAIVICGIMAIGVFVATPEGVARDRLICQSSGGVPIMNRERDQMIDCAMPLNRTR